MSRAKEEKQSLRTQIKNFKSTLEGDLRMIFQEAMVAGELSKISLQKAFVNAKKAVENAKKNSA